jgi:hypothetical protein
MPWGVPSGAVSADGQSGIRPGVIGQQSAVVLVLLSVCTCGVYTAYWLYRTTRELKEALNDPRLSPGTDLLLSLVTCGLWGIYVQYRNAQLVHRALLRFDPGARDQSTAVLILNVAALVVVLTWLVALFILQEELNRLARFADGKP